jgi:hypothetical protein
MPDNVVSNPGAGGVTFATDEDGSNVHHPITKLEWGALDTFNLVDDTTGKRLPVKVADMDVLVTLTHIVASQTEILQQIYALLRGISLQLGDVTGLNVNDALQATLTAH